MSSFSVTCCLTQCQAVKFGIKSRGGIDVEAVLQRLDRLTLDQAHTAVLQTLETVYGLAQKMDVVIDREQMHSAYDS